MARYVFFSFAYDDVRNFRVNVVRNSWYYHNNGQETFVDGSMWEKFKGRGDVFLKNLIEKGLNQTSVTAVLIGTTTAERRWVKYEIVRSFERGNGILAIHINRIRSKNGEQATRGVNPLDKLGFKISDDGKKIYFYELINRRWVSYADLPVINNKKSNSLYFEDSFWNGNEFGEFFRFSEKFDTYCWKMDDGHNDFTDWIEDAAEVAGR